MSKFYSDALKNLKPYVPGEQPKDKQYVKLNTNENPFQPPAEINKFLANVDVDRLKLYPDPDVSELKEALANKYRVKKENVFVGNGSDEILAMSFMAFFNSNKAIKFPDITYSFYPVYAQLFGVPTDIVPVNSDLSIPVEKMLGSDGGVIFPNPNAPTGMALPIDQIETILINNANVVVIVDEAYVDFGAQSAIPLIDKYPNLLVIQTFSKSRSLAGARVGYAIANAELIAGLEMVKNSFNSYTLDYLAQQLALISLKNDDYNEKNVKQICETREWTFEQLSKLGFRCIESKANFLFVTSEKVEAKKAFEYLKSNGVLVRYFDLNRINNYLRITIGTPEQMETLISNLKQLMV